MSTFDSTKTSLSDLLKQIIEGRLQLPDFQRGWVWDDPHIRSLLVSIARSFPIGSIMLLEIGGTVRFQSRPIEGVPLRNGIAPERLILDGQQRLTSLTQVLKSEQPVSTKDEKNRDVKRFYYIDIEKALEDETLEGAIIGVDETRLLKTNFGKDIVLDLSTRENEFDRFCFPCNQVLISDTWEEGLFKCSPERFSRYMEFRARILAPFRSYLMPVIELKKETSKEAVCLVFEKVNTGGVTLNVFELATATYAADGFNLRDDWFGRPPGIAGRHKRLAAQPLLRDVEATEFLQGLSLLHTYDRRAKDLGAGKVGKAASAVSAKREDVLDLPLAAYQEWAEHLTTGFFLADQFLRSEGFYDPKYLPYRSQLIPLAATMAHIGERWMEPRIREKLARWFWCGVLGEQYGGSIETRIALDFPQLIEWLTEAAAPEPATVTGAGFQGTRLDTLRTRTSAAYRGIYILIQRAGSRDFFWRERMMDVDRNDYAIDIHHIFPRKWCDDRGISPAVYNSIVNKTPISYKANRTIGGKAPSLYLAQLRSNPKVDISTEEQDEILASHLINAHLLRSDDFTAFFNDRKAALLRIIRDAMGKEPMTGGEQPPEDQIDEADEVEQVETAAA